VFPYEIEDVLAKHPLIKEVAVVGMPDEKRGNIIHAVIVPASDELTKKDVVKYCRGTFGRIQDSKTCNVCR